MFKSQRRCRIELAVIRDGQAERFADAYVGERDLFLQVDGRQHAALNHVSCRRFHVKHSLLHHLLDQLRTGLRSRHDIGPAIFEIGPVGHATATPFIAADDIGKFGNGVGAGSAANALEDCMRPEKLLNRMQNIVAAILLDHVESAGPGLVPVANFFDLVEILHAGAPDQIGRVGKGWMKTANEPDEHGDPFLQSRHFLLCQPDAVNVAGQPDYGKSPLLFLDLLQDHAGRNRQILRLLRLQHFLACPGDVNLGLQRILFIHLHHDSTIDIPLFQQSYQNCGNDATRGGLLPYVQPVGIAAPEFPDHTDILILRNLPEGIHLQAVPVKFLARARDVAQITVGARLAGKDRVHAFLRVLLNSDRICRADADADTALVAIPVFQYVLYIHKWVGPAAQTTAAVSSSTFSINFVSFSCTRRSQSSSNTSPHTRRYVISCVRNVCFSVSISA